MRVTYLIIIVFLLNSCKDRSSKINVDNSGHTSNTIEKIENDSIDVWVNTLYLHSLEKEISICDLKKTRHILLYFDSTQMKLLITSGNDSEIIIPMKKIGDRYLYDSISNYLPIESIEIEMITKDTLILNEPKYSNKFIRKKFPFDNKFNVLNNFDFSDAISQLNSHLIIKYKKVDSLRSTSLFIEPDSLKKMIHNGMVDGYCSDDFYDDGITIRNDSIQYFEVQFDEGQITLYKHSGRSKGEKLNLDSLPKQIIRIENYEHRTNPKSY